MKSVANCVYILANKTNVAIYVGAIEREKQLKSWSRARKNQLIESLNPEWEDFYESTLE